VLITEGLCQDYPGEQSFSLRNSTHWRWNRIQEVWITSVSTQHLAFYLQ